ncbi:MAG: hypothetical protein P9L91_08640, partial [Candidatus Zophobacter franzmannii]|nr:hypothetical protein [Candidatus Zophobacter franzmannii]
MDDGHVTSLGAIALDSTSFVTYYECDGGEARPGLIDGDSIVLGPVSNFTSGWNPWYMDASPLSDSSFVLAYGYFHFCGLARVGMLRDNTINFGSSVVFDSTRVNSVFSTTMDNNHFVLSYGDKESGYDTTICTTILGSVSGYNITFGNEYPSSLYTSTQPGPVATLDPNHFVISHSEFTSSWQGGAKLGTISLYPIQTMASNVNTCGGSEFFPVFGNYINQICQFSLFMEYDTSKVTFLSFQNPHTQLIVDSLSISSNNGIINIQYSSNIPINISSDLLMELLFETDSIQNGDVYHFTWIDTLSLYINNFGDTIASQFTNGSMVAFESVGAIGSISGSDSICEGLQNEVYNISSIENCSSYTWTLEPDSAGVIQAIDTSATINFVPGFAGNAVLSIFGTNVCGSSDTSFLSINIINTPTADAGSDTTICENSICLLSGEASFCQNTFWATLGDGNFSDPFLLNTLYTPGANDIENGNVNLILFAYALNPCTGEVGDTLNLTIIQAPEVYAGEDDSVCSGNSYLLSGTSDNYSSTTWSTSGDGIIDNPNQLSTLYYPGSEDITNG